HGTWGTGGGWPGGGGIGFPGGGGVGFPGGGPVVLGPGGDRSHTAGTAEIAQDSGGDTMPVSDASALEETLARLRQRYALHFYLPEGATATDREAVRVDLSSEARIRYPDADVHYRRIFLSAAAGEQAGRTIVTHAPPPGEAPVPADSTASSESTTKHKRVAVNEDSGPVVNTIDPDGNAAPSSSTNTQSAPASKGGWPKADGQNAPH